MGIFCQDIDDLCSARAGHALKQQICGHHACSSVRGQAVLYCRDQLPSRDSLQTIGELFQLSRGQEAGMSC